MDHPDARETVILGTLISKLLYDTRQLIDCRAAERYRLNRSNYPVANLFCSRSNTTNGEQALLGFLVQQLRFGRGGKCSLGVVEQVETEILVQIGKGDRYSGLGQVQAFSCMGDGTLLHLR